MDYSFFVGVHKRQDTRNIPPRGGGGSNSSNQGPSPNRSNHSVKIPPESTLVKTEGPPPISRSHSLMVKTAFENAKKHELGSNIRRVGSESESELAARGELLGKHVLLRERSENPFSTYSHEDLDKFRKVNLTGLNKSNSQSHDSDLDKFRKVTGLNKSNSQSHDSDLDTETRKRIQTQNEFMMQLHEALERKINISGDAAQRGGRDSQNLDSDIERGLNSQNLDSDSGEVAQKRAMQLKGTQTQDEIDRKIMGLSKDSDLGTDVQEGFQTQTQEDIDLKIMGLGQTKDSDSDIEISQMKRRGVLNDAVKVLMSMCILYVCGSGYYVCMYVCMLRGLNDGVKVLMSMCILCVCVCV
jgi:hypothetical protein